MTLYKLLNTNAMNWWHHRDLRKQGKDKEARMLERKSILSSVRTLRAAIKNEGYCEIGLGGWSIHYDNGCHLAGYGDAKDAMVQAAILVGIPTVDLTTAPRDALYDNVVKMPMIGVNRVDKKPKGGWHGFSYAPLDYVFERWAKLGATMYNWPK